MIASVFMNRKLEGEDDLTNEARRTNGYIRSDFRPRDICTWVVALVARAVLTVVFQTNLAGSSL
jgi:hypothetical protein